MGIYQVTRTASVIAKFGTPSTNLQNFNRVLFFWHMAVRYEEPNGLLSHLAPHTSQPYVNIGSTKTSNSLHLMSISWPPKSCALLNMAIIAFWPLFVRVSTHRSKEQELENITPRYLNLLNCWCRPRTVLGYTFNLYMLFWKSMKQQNNHLCFHLAFSSKLISTVCTWFVYSFFV